MLHSLLVFLHQSYIILTITLNFSGSLHGRISGASLAKTSKFTSKNRIHLSSKLGSNSLSTGLSLILISGCFMVKILSIALEISIPFGLWANIW